ncbi:hypothetical protein ACIGNX_27165 [Actinosynnema sp. NPDC053489]|uniref:hypothetical protein n=1 Tax=Actinosynnema sp. NPDC053489 TaxID=3363916 RepID=UPI0037C71096
MTPPATSVARWRPSSAAGSVRSPSVPTTASATASGRVRASVGGAPVIATSGTTSPGPAGAVPTRGRSGPTRARASTRPSATSTA